MVTTVKFLGGLFLAAGLLVPQVALADIAIVPAFPCVEFFGGNWTVPAGSEVVVAQRWEANTRGLVRDFLRAQSTDLTVNGGAPVDVSDQWGTIILVPADHVYRTSMFLPTGVTLAAGESMTFDLVLALSHRLLDGLTLADGDSHKPLFFGPGVAFEFACTVTAE